jgi:hypothetical protein
VIRTLLVTKFNAFWHLMLDFCTIFVFPFKVTDLPYDNFVQVFGELFLVEKPVYLCELSWYGDDCIIMCLNTYASAAC